MARTAVDVVVVSWNVRDELMACLESVLSSNDVDVQVVVVDNASDDGSADGAAARFPDVTVLQNQTNVGFARAANQGMAAGHNPWVLLLNPDTVVPPTALAALVGRLAALPRHGMIVPQLTNEKGEVQRSIFPSASLGTMFLFMTGAHRLLSRRRRQRLLMPGAWESVEQDVPWAIGAAMLVRRSAVERVGPLDESFFVYVEDMEWCERFWASGYGIRYAPDISMVHFGNRSGEQRFGSERTREHMRNTARYLRRHHSSLWVATFMGLSGATACSRALVTRLTAQVRPSPERWAAHAYWRDQAAYHLGPVAQWRRRRRRTSAET